MEAHLHAGSNANASVDKQDSAMAPEAVHCGEEVWRAALRILAGFDEQGVGVRLVKCT